MRTPWRISLAIVASMGVGCQSAPPQAEAPRPEAREVDSQRRPLGYINGEPVTGVDLLPDLVEAAGGAVWADRVLDAQIADRLAERGITLSDAQVEIERVRVMQALSEDADTAQRLLDELRRERGLGERRFAAFLRRSAALRALIHDEVDITDGVLKQEYMLRHGPRYRTRLIMAGTRDDAVALRRRALAGESFSDLASLHSTDASAARGGLLSPISPADASYPEAVRSAVVKLEEGQVSNVVALPGGFAVLKLEDKIAPPAVEFADVTDELARSARLRVERVLMAQKARELMSGADVIVLDPVLQAAWEQRQAAQ